MLQRSQDAPISIFHDFSIDYIRSASHEESIRNALEQHIHHIGDINLIAPPLTFSALVNLLHRPAPELINLRLICTGAIDEGYIRDSQRDDLFVNNAPCLRTIALRGVIIPLDSALLSPQLTELSLYDIVPQVSFPAGQLVHVLGTLPKLKILRIQYSNPVQRLFSEVELNRYSFPDDPVVLANLRILVFCATARYTATVMRHIAIPSDAETTFEILPSKVSTSFIPHFIGFGSSGTPWNSLYIEQRNHGMVISAYMEDVDGEVEAKTYEEDQDLRVPMPFTFRPEESRERAPPFTVLLSVGTRLQYFILPQLLQNLPLDGIRILTIEIPDMRNLDRPLRTKDWNALFAPFKNVVALRIWDGHENDDVPIGIEPGLRSRQPPDEVENYDNAEPRFVGLSHIHIHIPNGINYYEAELMNLAPWFNELVYYRRQSGTMQGTYSINGYIVDDEDLEDWLAADETEKDVPWRGV